MKTPVKRVLVTGTGRSGTSAFMKFVGKSHGVESIFCRDAGLGANKENIFRNVNQTMIWNPETRAGHEFFLDSNCSDEIFQQSPYVIKNPSFCAELKGLLLTGKIEVEHIFVLIRDYKKSALSRKKDGLPLMSLKHIRQNDSRYDVLKNTTIFHQRLIGNLFETIAEYDIPHTVVHFPTFVGNADYLFKKLKNTPLELSRDKFDQAFPVLDKNLVNH